MRVHLKKKVAFFNQTIPITLAVCFAVVWFFPKQNELLGWGEDPAFNLWTLEQVWKQLSAHGLLQLFFSEFWKTPIFHPLSNTLALSENMVFLGILSWPIRLLSGNGIFTLNFFAVIMSLFTFLISSLCFRAFGLKKNFLWGGLFFQACGWLQNHYAHYQNISIFLFPLALYFWTRFIESPTRVRAFLCGFFVGWAMGWNVYFQMFLNLIFFGLISYTFLKKEHLRSHLFIVIGTIGLVELPFALKYFEVESFLGSLKVSAGVFSEQSASLLSVFGQCNHQTLLQRMIGFYPIFRTHIEAAGFLGICWTGIWLFSISKKENRVFALAALSFFIISLGPQFGLMNLLKLFPGLQGLRAIGRFQVLVAFFSLPAVLLWIEKQGLKKQRILLSLVLLELIPGRLPSHVSFPESLYSDSTTPFEKKLAAMPKNEPAWVIPFLSSRFQLLMARSDQVLIQGYSGRTPLNAELLQVLSKGGLTPKVLKSLLNFSRVKRVISVDPGQTSFLESQPFLKAEGCFEHYEFQPCLFAVSGNHEELNQPRIELDRDTQWEYLPISRGHTGVLKSKADGVLDYSLVGQCWLEEKIHLNGWTLWKSRKPFFSWGFRGVEFKVGEEILEIQSKQWIFSLPIRMRPEKSYAVVCNRKHLK